MIPDTTPLSAKNPRVRRLKRLVSRGKARSEERAFVVDGRKLVAEALASDLKVLEVFHEPGALESSGVAAALAASPGSDCFELDPSVLASALDAVNPQPIAAVVELPDWPASALDQPGPILVAAQLRDPGNLGTVLRTAEAAGLVGAAVVGESVDRFSPKAVRASAGSVLRLPVLAWKDEATGIEALAATGRPLVAAVVDPAAQPYHDVDLTNAAIMVGNEPHGLSHEALERAEIHCTIPLEPSVESLNVAAAAAILSFEAARQRRQAR